MKTNTQTQTEATTVDTGVTKLTRKMANLLNGMITIAEGIMTGTNPSIERAAELVGDYLVALTGSEKLKDFASKMADNVTAIVTKILHYTYNKLSELFNWIDQQFLS